MIDLKAIETSLGYDESTSWLQVRDAALALLAALRETRAALQEFVADAYAENVVDKSLHDRVAAVLAKVRDE